MEIRVLRVTADGNVTLTDVIEPSPPGGWMWIDARVDDESIEALVEVASLYEFDALAVRDSVDDFDLPKVDDFGHHLLAILHGVRDDAVATYELDCFLAENVLMTVHTAPSPSVDALWAATQVRTEIAAGGPDELLARLADIVTRRLLAVIDAFDDRAEDLMRMALTANNRLLAEVTAVRTDLRAIRRVAYPQREALDVLRSSSSPLITDAGRRRFSDVFDVASRAAQGIDVSRSSLAEILDAYRGAEARAATDVTKVLTVYAAIMLPLGIVTGFFGMNFDRLPAVTRTWGWIAVVGAMGGITVMSLGVFVALGWIRRPSGRAAGVTLGKGLAEAARAPAQVVGAVYELSTLPIRTAGRLTRNFDSHGASSPAHGSDDHREDEQLS